MAAIGEGEFENSIGSALANHLDDLAAMWKLFQLGAGQLVVEWWSRKLPCVKRRPCRTDVDYGGCGSRAGWRGRIQVQGHDWSRGRRGLAEGCKARQGACKDGVQFRVSSVQLGSVQVQVVSVSEDR